MSEPEGFSAPLAAFYEATHDYGDVGDEGFYVGAATAADGPVLEGACGSGRLYLEFCRQGVDADGFDASTPMLSLLREQAAREGLSPAVWQADLRTVGADRTYELAVVPYNSMCVLQTVDDQLAALRSLYDVLADGGRLLFDVYVPRYEVVAESFGEWHSVREFEYGDETLTGRSRAILADETAQTYRTEQELRDAGGEVVARDEFVLSHLPAQQVELLARQSPFTEWTVNGGFDGQPLGDGDDVQVWELVK
ncbi:class I SAM-dependent methyltransferase [Halobacterium jilantaiense]|uniref:Methyltransferase domain-containing protein n=1 Tax=Halobacterium jilantaiense TaxID=355548 RepID=A0A1I0Q4Q3_9EURY|nr:class I SAM-dependent methyltransferase [Halobacterium jilantaiense]SEW21756.1 Methyltransferase domain-containing protein [Halobacterium jilantaiense]